MNIVHISDIHFKPPPGSPQGDHYLTVRKACLTDIETLVAAHGPAGAVAVTGDISARGDSLEFGFARSWLAEVCAAAKCKNSNVNLVPGNHDVDRGAISSSAILQLAHDKLRSSAAQDRDLLFESYLNDAELSAMLFRPLHAFNDFAETYGCASLPEEINWTHTQAFEYGYRLRFTGLNSVIFSDKNDDDAKNKLILGSMQTLRPIERGIIDIGLCHHPDDWLFDHDDIHERFKHRFQLQLFGHKHKNLIDRHVETCVIHAGALQLERTTPGFLPEYNFIKLGMDVSADPKFTIVAMRRRWSPADYQFVGVAQPENKMHVDHSVVLSPQRRLTITVVTVAEGTPQSQNTTGVGANMSDTLPMHEINDEDARALLYDFHSIGATLQASVAKSLNLIEPEEAPPFDGAQIARIFKRAKDKSALEAMWTLVQNALGGSAPNPFAGK